ncbi:hypothetical protein niasHT_037411 [Heterodera trifolii]|uniref:Uncharacterized protein n=1 Tax=Heterodera trifolii TaxID=157864 RepID=A0ABD2J4W4_9BILA
MYEFQTNSTGQIKFTFDKPVFGNQLIDVHLKHPNAATPIKMFVFDGNEERFLHKFKNYGQMVEDRKRNEYRLYEGFQIVFKNLPLVENEEIAFLFGDNEDADDDEDDDDDEEEDEEDEDEKPKKNLPLVEEEEIDFQLDDDEDEEEGDDDDDEEEEEEHKRKPKKKAFGFLKKIFKKKRH